MGQKVNPHGMRVGVIKDWDSRWYASDEKVGDLIVEDQKIRKFLKKTLYSAGVPRIEIERSSDVVTIFLHCARPGMVIGKGGEQIEQYRQAVEKLIGKKVKLNIVEVKSPDMDAQLVAENIAQQLEKRISHRRAMKNAMARAMRAGAKGIKCCCSGRLGGREIAGVEHYHEGTIPLQTIRADIDYGFTEAATTFGRIGVKVWVYKGEVLSQTLRTTPRTMDTTKPYQERRERRPRRDGDRRSGGYNRGGQGGYNRGGQGGYNRGGQGGGFNRGGQGGGFNRGGQSGGFNRAPQGGGFNRAPQGGGFNRAPQGGGFNRAPQGGGFNRTNTPPRPAVAPAAPAEPKKEGGAE
jgi:small subunit ribosomal protein S3